MRQSWRYAGLGDATAAAAWRATSERAPFELWLRGGLKAPTGARSVPLVHGEEPEPAARPGTGSWDALAGVHAMLRAPWAAGRDTAGTMFAGLEARWNGRGTEGYRVGRELRASLGASRRLAGPVTALGQLNLRVSGRDTPGSTHGLIANTGGSWLFVSPGFSVRARGASISAHLQIPVVQRVNRIQLVAPWMLLTGVTWEI